MTGPEAFRASRVIWKHLRRRSEPQPDLVAQHVVRAHRSALRRRDRPTLERAARPVERPAAHHVPRPRVGAVGVLGVRVVVVVEYAEDVGQLVGVDGTTVALAFGRDQAGQRVRPDVLGREERRPIDVAGVGPVAMIGFGGPELSVTSSLVSNIACPKFSHTPGLVVAGMQEGTGSRTARAPAAARPRRRSTPPGARHRSRRCSRSGRGNRTRRRSPWPRTRTCSLPSCTGRMLRRRRRSARRSSRASTRRPCARAAGSVGECP